MQNYRLTAVVFKSVLECDADTKRNPRNEAHMIRVDCAMIYKPILRE